MGSGVLRGFAVAAVLGALAALAGPAVACEAEVRAPDSGCSGEAATTAPSAPEDAPCCPDGCSHCWLPCCLGATPAKLAPRGIHLGPAGDGTYAAALAALPVRSRLAAQDLDPPPRA